MIIIVCGVSGTGKSTIGKGLAEALAIPFFDGDDFHPECNVQKMKNGFSLNDDDRKPWLEQLSREIALWEKTDGAVLACSSLKESYRKILISRCSEEVKWVILNGSTELLTERLGKRKGHFFNPKLLDSQLSTFELPDYGWIIDIKSSPTEIIEKVLIKLREA